jgi:hypothetical protein
MMGAWGGPQGPCNPLMMGAWGGPQGPCNPLMMGAWGGPQGPCNTLMMGAWGGPQGPCNPLMMGAWGGRDGIRMAGMDAQVGPARQAGVRWVYYKAYCVEAALWVRFTRDSNKYDVECEHVLTQAPLRMFVAHKSGRAC